MASPAVNGLRDWILAQLASTLAVLVFLTLGIWAWSLLFFSWIPMPGINDQPANVQAGNMDIASLKHIIFESETWWHPPPSPPSLFR